MNPENDKALDYEEEKEDEFEDTKKTEIKTIKRGPTPLCSMM